MRKAFGKGALLFLFSEKSIPWSWLFGSDDPNFSISYYIGENFLENENANSNTNAFFSALAEKGIFGYFMATIFVSIILSYFDYIWKKNLNQSFIFIGFLYGILLLEQSYSVSFVSSGVGLIFLLILFESPD